MEPTRAHGRCLALALAAGLAAPALGQANQARPFAPLPSLSVAEMATLRGGLEVAGLRMDLTAELRTYIDHRLALATEYRLTQLAESRQMIQTRLQEGRQTLQAALGAPHAPPTPTAVTTAPATTSAPAANEPPAGVPGSAGADARQVTSPPPGIQVTTTTGGSTGRGTVTVTGDTGITVVTHTVGSEQILSSVTNTANGRQIRQEIGINLTVHNFSEFASKVSGVLNARRIGRAATGALLR